MQAAARHASRRPAPDPDRIHANVLRTAGLLCAVAFLSGCTYSFTGTNLPGHIRSIAIPNAANETLEPGLDQEVTDMMLGRFLQDGRLKIAPEAQADARLDARVLSYENMVRNYAPDETPLDYIVVVGVSVVMWDQVRNRQLWKDDRIIRTGVYVPGGGSELATEREARAQAIADMASDLVSRTLEQW